MDFTTLYHFSYTEILSINIKSDINMAKAISCFIISILTLFFLGKMNLFILERKKEKKLYESTLMDKDLLNRTVVLLMCKLLQSDQKEVYANKLTFVVNYIRASFDNKESIDKIIDELVIKHTSSHSYTLNEKIRKYIKKINIRQKLINPQGWFHELRRKQDYSVYEGMYNHDDFYGLPNSSIHELALALADYLTEEQKKYLSYLLFQMAHIDSNINKQEEKDLRNICVNNFLSEEEFYALSNHFELKSEDIWFNKNLKEKNPELYSDPEFVTNIFPKDEKSEEERKKTFIINTDTMTIEIYLVFLFLQSIITILVVSNTSNVFFTTCIVPFLAALFFAAIYHSNKILSSIYETLISRKDYIHLIKECLYANILYLTNIIFIYFVQ